MTVSDSSFLHAFKVAYVFAALGFNLEMTTFLNSPEVLDEFEK